MFTIGMLFWLIYIIGLIFYGYRNSANVPMLVDSLFWWVLIALLGFGTFGSPLK